MRKRCEVRTRLLLDHLTVKRMSNPTITSQAAQLEAIEGDIDACVTMLASTPSLETYLGVRDRLQRLEGREYPDHRTLRLRANIAKNRLNDLRGSLVDMKSKLSLPQAPTRQCEAWNSTHSRSLADV
jgi:hypothetical protein